MKILVTPTSFNKPEAAAARKLLAQFADELVDNTLGRPMTEDEISEYSKGCDGILAGLDSITEKAIAQMDSSLKCISRYGAGVDRVDLPAAGKKGIVVTNTPGANANAVADLTFALALAAARKVPALDKAVRDGGWPRTQGIELYGKKMGIIGLGAIGKGVAKRAQGFSMEVLSYDPYMNHEYAATNNIKVVELSEIFTECDVISLHLPLTEETKHIVDAKAIASMKQGVILINASRGGLIDEDAAYKALKAGKMGGLGMDAFEVEPPENSPLFELDNVVVTPHAGAHTSEAVQNMAMMAVQNIIDVLSGKECPFVVNKKFLG